MSARAAWRLIQLGFTQVYRYTPGKTDWLANGLPFEGKEAHLQRAGDLVNTEVPTCRLTERIGVVKKRIQKTGWDTCVVTNEEQVVLGLLRPEMLTRDPQSTAEQVMESAPRTYRLNSPYEKALKYMQKNGLDSALVTTSDGKLFGILKRAGVEQAMASQSQTTQREG